MNEFPAAPSRSSARWRFRDWSLRWKMMALLFAASSLPLAAASLVAFRSEGEQARRSAVALLTARAEWLAEELDDFNRQYAASASRFSELPDVKASIDAGGSDDRRGKQLAPILNLRSSADPNVRSLAIFDPKGQPLLSTGGEIGRYESPAAHMPRLQLGLVSISDLYISANGSSEEASIAYFAPIPNGQGRIAGVVALYVRAEGFWEVLRAANGRAGRDSFAVVLDRDGIRVGHSAADRYLYRPAVRLEPATLERLVAQERFGERTRRLLETPVQAQEPWELARSQMGESTFRLVSPVNDAWNIAVARRLETVPWTVFYLVPEQTLLGGRDWLLRESAFASLLIMSLSLGAGLLLSARIARPVLALAAAAKRIAAGDLTARVSFGRGDEVGELADNFDRMAAALQESCDKLESKVRERTEALECAKSELVERSARLAEWSAEIARRQARDLVYGRVLAALVAHGSLEEVLAPALDEAAGLVSGSTAACYRWTASGAFVLIGRSRPSRKRDGSGRRRADPRAGETLSGAEHRCAADALATGRPAVLEAAHAPRAGGREGDAAAAGRRRGLMLIPLAVGGRKVGALRVEGPYPLASQASSFFEDLAVPFALTLLRHELHSQTERFAEALASRNEELRQQAEELARQRDELRAHHVALEAKSREVERANQLKSEFLANVSHELRTPLNAVIGFSELLREEAEAALSERQNRWVEDIVASGRHLLNLINDILDLAKIEAGRSTVAPEPVDPSEAIEEAASLVAPQAARRRISVEARVSASAPALADPRQLRQILLNLLSNAVKFSAEQSRVEAGAEPCGTAIRFWVRDEGPGIDESLRPDLFKPFVQGESALVKTHQGTGLGLVISRKLVEQNGGSIAVESGHGRGVTVSFTLPAARTENGPSRRESKPSDGAAAAGEEGSPWNSERAGARPLPPVSDDGLLVLVAEAGTAAGLGVALRAAGYKIAGIEPGADLAVHCARLNPSAVVVDLMQEENLRSFWELGRSRCSRSIPVIAAAVVAPPARIVAMSGRDILFKPIDGEEILSRLRQLEPEDISRPAEAVLAIGEDEGGWSHVGSTLAGAGLRLIRARTGAEGLDRAARDRPDLAIVQLCLPDISGCETAGRLSELLRPAGVPVLLLADLALSDADRRLLLQQKSLAPTGEEVPARALIAAVSRAIGEAAGARTPARSASILIVDDHDLSRELARAQVEKLGYRAFTAVDGHAALELAREVRPQLVLLDLAMPGMDGFETARQLRADPCTAEIPIVALTALAMRGDERRVRAAGFDGYLTKPIEPRDLEAALGALVMCGASIRDGV